MEPIFVFRVTGLPRGITPGLAFNLIWTFPGLASSQLEQVEDEPVFTVRIAGALSAQFFCRSVHGRPYDLDIPGSKPMAVECCGQVIGPELAVTQLESAVRGPARSNTLYGRGISDSECPKYVEEELWRTGLEGITDVRVVRRYSTRTSLVFVDFETPAQARAAERKWRRGVQMKTGVCTFSVSRHGRT